MGRNASDLSGTLAPAASSSQRGDNSRRLSGSYLSGVAEY